MITTPSFAWCIEKPTAVEIENRNIANIIDLISKKKKERKMKMQWHKPDSGNFICYNKIIFLHLYTGAIGYL